MKRFAAPVEDYLQSMMLRERSPAFLHVDEEGCLWEWGGPLRNYGIRRVTKGKPIGTQVYFLEGLLPLAGESLVVPCVETDPGVFLDIHIFHSREGDWVLLLDAREEAAQRLQLVQTQPGHHEARDEGRWFWGLGFEEGVGDCLERLSRRDDAAQVAVLFAGMTQLDGTHAASGAANQPSLYAITRPAQFGAEWFATRAGSAAVSLFCGGSPQLPPQKQAVRAALGMLRVAMSSPPSSDGLLASVGIVSGPVSQSAIYLEQASKLQSAARSGEVLIDNATHGSLEELQGLFVQSPQGTAQDAFCHAFTPDPHPSDGPSE